MRMFVYNGQQDEAICLARPSFLPMTPPPHIHNVGDPTWAGIWPVERGATILVDSQGQAHILVDATHMISGIATQ